MTPLNYVLITVACLAFSPLVKAFNAQMLPDSITLSGITFQPEKQSPTTLGTNTQAGSSLREWSQPQAASRIAFFHTFEPGRGIEDWRAAVGQAHRNVELPQDWPAVFCYEIEYADGVRLTIPVRFGEGIRESRRVQSVGPMLWAREAWVKELDAVTTEKAVVYAMVVPNPRPEQALKAVRYLPSEDAWRDWGTGMLFDIQTDITPTTGKLYVVNRKPMGNDKNAGTYDSPFATIHHAVALAQAGDTVLVRGGLYAFDEAVNKKFNGDSNKPLTLSAFPGETPVIDGYGVNLDSRPEDSEAFKAYRAAIGGRMEQDTGMLSFWGDPDGLRIQGMHVHNSRRAGISVYGLADPNSGKAENHSWGVSQDIEIAFNTTYHSFAMGIISHRTDRIRVIGNTVILPHSPKVVTNRTTGALAAHDHHPQEAIDLSRNRFFEIAWNTVSGGRKEAIDCISVEDGIIHHNYVESSLNGIYIDAWSVPIRRLKIYRNYINNAFNGIPLATEGSNDLEGFDIFNNIVVNSKSSAISVNEATYKAKPAKVQKHRVFNNTIHGAGYHALAVGWQASGIEVSGFRDNPDFRDVEVLNNIVVDAAGRPLKNAYRDKAEHNISFVRNLVWPALEDTTPQWMRTKEKSWYEEDLEFGKETLVKDPLFHNPMRGDYRLAETSPARKAGSGGVDLGAIPFGQAWFPGLDFAGNVTAHYQAATVWEPLVIPTDKFTAFRNNLQRPSWFQTDRYGNDFSILPEGEQVFAGVRWHIPADKQNARPNVMVLAGIQTESSATSIEGIPVGRTAAKLAFLHNAHVVRGGKVKSGDAIFHYRVNYADGSTAEIPIRLGHEIDAWNLKDPSNLKNGRIAWAILKMPRKPPYHLSQIFVSEWSNPKPAVAIASIDIIRDADPLAVTPAVFAISTGN